MAIDYGDKRVGLASTDDAGSFALPRLVLPNDDRLLEEVLKFKKEHGIDRIVIGESKNFKGEENEIMTKARAFAQALTAAGCDVHFHPEVLTTMEARQIQGNTPMTDASAAALILKNYVDSQSSAG